MAKHYNGELLSARAIIPPRAEIWKEKKMICIDDLSQAEYSAMVQNRKFGFLNLYKKEHSDKIYFAEDEWDFLRYGAKRRKYDIILRLYDSGMTRPSHIAKKMTEMGISINYNTIYDCLEDFRNYVKRTETDGKQHNE